MEISFGRRRRPENFGGIYKKAPPYLRQFWKKGGVFLSIQSQIEKKTI